MKRLLMLISLLAIIYTTQAQRYRVFGSDDYTKFRIGLQGGWSYRLAKVSDDVPAPFKSYIQGLKSGFHFGADASFFLNRTYGLGIRYSGFTAGNEIDGLSGIDSSNGKAITGSMSDDIMMHYIGPQLNMRYISDNGWFQLLATVSFGYLSYTDNNKTVTKYTFVNDDVMVYNTKLTSGTFGSVLG